MNYKNYIKNNKLILPEGFNSPLSSCSYNDLTELILPEGFNSHLYCDNNNLIELILPEGFNRYLDCDNPDIIKIANCMEKFKLNYWEAGIKIIDKLNLDKLPKLKSHYSLRETAPQYRNLKLNILLNEL